MPRYSVTFSETCTYQVEFESDVELDPDDEDSSKAWFTAMEEDPATEDWVKKRLLEVNDRELEELKRID